jgi:deferrochelatase/peroxidase EfeB
MSGSLQEGIYYDGREIGKSFCILFLKIVPGSTSTEIRTNLEKIWFMLQDLKMGIVKEIDVNQRNRKADNLSVLIGYGPDLFNKAIVRDIKRSIPKDLESSSLFIEPDAFGGGPIVKGSGLNYANDVQFNHVNSEHIMFQFIADTEFATNRAVVELWSLIGQLNNDSKKSGAIRFSNWYSGFRRSDNRGWLGFHESVSNLRREDRISALSINKNNISGQSENWILNGTYLAFLRLAIDLPLWRSIKREDQERLVGRDKLTGCPFIGVDRNAQPYKDSRCPIRGTFEVIEKGNESFREHPKYGTISSYGGISNKSLGLSHIGRTNKADKISPAMNESYRIFRQGFEFLEPHSSPPFLRLGLNFVSFQNRTSKLINILSSSSYMGGTNFGGDPAKPIQGTNRFTSVRSAGFFLVPPAERSEIFPGSRIFS